MMIIVAAVDRFNQLIQKNPDDLSDLSARSQQRRVTKCKRKMKKIKNPEERELLRVGN